MRNSEYRTILTAIYNKQKLLGGDIWRSQKSTYQMLKFNVPCLLILFLFNTSTINAQLQYSHEYHLDFEGKSNTGNPNHSWSENETTWSISSGIGVITNESNAAFRYSGTYTLNALDNGGLGDFTLENTVDFNLSSLYMQWQFKEVSNATIVVFTGYDANDNQISTPITVNTSTLSDGNYHKIQLNLNGIRKLKFHPNGSSNSAGSFSLDYFTYTHPITWNGITSSSWTDLLNWTPNILPDANTVINIPANTSHDPSFNSGVFGGICLDLTIQSGARLTVPSAKVLEVDRNIVNYGGTLDISSGILTLGGSDAQNLSPNTFLNNTLKTLIIDNSAGVTQNSSLTVTDLIINPGKSFTVPTNKLLELHGNITNNGNFDMTNAGLIMAGSSAQTISSFTNNSTFLNNSINTLIINNTAGVSLDGSLNITGSVVPNNGTLTTNDNLILGSSINGSANVTQGNSHGGYINGNVFVKRYLGTADTKWRMIGFPFIRDPLIVGTFSSDGYKAFIFNESADDGRYGGTNSPTNYNAGWYNIGFQNISAAKGILISTPNPMLAQPIMFLGPINLGDQLIPLSYNVSSANKGWNLIANPFAANINWTSIIANNSNIDNAIYRYNPNTDAYASYVNGIGTGNQSNVIENGAGFFVHSIGATSLIINESDKTNDAPAARLFGTETVTNYNKSILKLSLLKDGDTAGDEAIVRWGEDPATDNFDSKYDAYDMGRTKGADLSVLGKDGTAYSIFHGSTLLPKDKEQREIAIAIKNLAEGNYTIKSEILSPMYFGNNVFLMDHFTNQATLISSNNSAYTFAVTANTNTSLSNRFSLVFNYKPSITIAENDIKLLNNPTTLNQFNIVMGSNYQKVNWVLVDNIGRVHGTGVFNAVIKGTVYNASISTISSGTYFIKLMADGIVLPTQKWIKQ